jgi:hypothetical protein
MNSAMALGNIGGIARNDNKLYVGHVKFQLSVDHLSREGQQVTGFTVLTGKL